MAEHEDGHELVMPFICVASQGGAYEDDSFIAGVYFGHMWAKAEACGSFSGCVPTGLVPQIDLLAMRHGLVLSSSSEPDSPEWTHVDAARPAEASSPARARLELEVGAILMDPMALEHLCSRSAVDGVARGAPRSRRPALSSLPP